MTARPWCCPEPRCTPLHLLAEAVAPGESFVCFGKAPEIEFTYDGVTHVNDLRSCHYTPLKGLIAYQENRTDWEAIRAGYWRALTALSATEGDTPHTSQPKALGETEGDRDGKHTRDHPDRSRQLAEGPDRRGIHGGPGVPDRTGPDPSRPGPADHLRRVTDAPGCLAASGGAPPDLEHLAATEGDTP